MKTRIITAVFFTLAILLFVIPGFKLAWLPIVLFAFVSMGASLELHQALLHKKSPLKFSTMLIESLIMLVPIYVWINYRALRPAWHILGKTTLPLDNNWQTDMVWLLSLSISTTAIVAFFVFIIVMLSNVLRKGPEGILNAVAEASALIYLALPFSIVSIFMFAIPHGYFWLLPAIFLPWVSDVFAYFTGVMWGKTKILPKISPKKTFEGFIGGIVGSMLVSSFYFMIAMKGAEPLRDSLFQNFLFGLIIGLVLSLASQLGDWLASALKRWVRIKDFSNLLPGHGGIIDRFDSVILTLPCTLICAVFYYLV